MRKILYSPGYGAGWSTWMDVPQKFACEYQPIIEALERGEILLEESKSKYQAEITDYHPAVQQFVKDCKEIYGEDYVCILGCEDLEIFECDDNAQIQIREYDGSESVHLKSENEWF